METMDAILKRRSCRSFTDQQISDEDLHRLLVAANAAPVGMATYDQLAISVIQDKQLIDKMEQAAKTALPDMRAEHPVYNAPTLILVSAKEKSGNYEPMHRMSVGCIIENIMLEAADLGLGSIFLMAVPTLAGKSPAIREAARVPEGFVPFAAAGVGYAAAPAPAHEASVDVIPTAYVC